jgi:hypothetical protein
MWLFVGKNEMCICKCGTAQIYESCNFLVNTNTAAPELKARSDITSQIVFILATLMQLQHNRKQEVMSLPKSLSVIAVFL